MGEKSRTIKVLFTASEAEPFYKVGGLGDYAGSLPSALKNYFSQAGENLDIRVVLPLHDPQDIASFKLTKVGDVLITGAENENRCVVFTNGNHSIPHYFIQQISPAPESDMVYGHDQYQTAYKFALFSIAVLHLTEMLEWAPDIIHTNDWHTALINHLVRESETHFDQPPGTLLTIHNMPFMGYGSESVYGEFGIKPSSVDTFPAWAQNLPLPMGIAAADQIVAVSPTYARELTTNYFAYGLEHYFLAHPEKLTGIINGIDYQKWDPAADPQVSHHFSAANLQPRICNKKELFNTIGFTFNEEEPLLVVISRLENQKGIDLILDALSETADGNWKAIILGSGHHGYEYAFKALEHAFPQKIHTVLEYNPTFAKKLYASGDMILMPSLYEPCGLSQMIAMRYGCVPVAHSVGGLKDSIITVPESERTGFLFSPAIKESFISSLRDALISFADRQRWEQIQRNGMERDFSWYKSAESYAKLYRQLSTKKRG